ncbi:MAG: MFS transporter [Halobacteriaceae archaeon]
MNFARWIDDARGFDRTVYAVLGARFINVIGTGVVYPYFTIHFFGNLGIPFTTVGLALFANNIALALGTIFGGAFADKFGRKPVMVVSMATSAITLAAYAWVNTASTLIAVASMAGFTAGLYAPAAQAMLADLTISSDREQAFGLLKVASNVGFGSGFVIGGLLYGIARESIFIIDGITSGIVAVLLLVLLPRIHGGTASTLQDTIREWTRAISQPRLLWLACLNVLFAIAYSQMQSTVPAFAEGQLGLSSGELGALYVINPLTVVFFQLPAVSWVESWRRTRALIFSTGFWAMSFGAILLAHIGSNLVGVVLIGAFLFLRTMGENLHSPLITSLTSDMADMETRGSQLSLLEVAKRIGFGIGPVIGGLFFDYGLEPYLWPTLILMCVVIAGGLLILEGSLSTRENSGFSS